MVRSSIQLYVATFDTTWFVNLRKRQSGPIDIRSHNPENTVGTFIFRDYNGNNALYYFEYLLWPEKNYFMLKGGSTGRNKAAKQFAIEYLGNDEKSGYQIKLHKNMTRQIIDKILSKHEKNKVLNPKFKFKLGLNFKDKEYGKLSYELFGKKSCALTDDKRDFEKLFKACNIYDFKSNMEIALCPPLVKAYDEEVPHTYTLNISSSYSLGINTDVSIYQWLEFYQKFI